MDERSDPQEQQIIVDQLEDGRWVASVRGGADKPEGLEFAGAFATEQDAVTAAKRHMDWQSERLAMSAAACVRRLLPSQPARIWTLHDLASEGDLAPTQTKVAVELLVSRGELVRKGEVYRRPFGGEVTRMVDRSGCREQRCNCHDGSVWVPGAYPNGCTHCGCRWVE